MSLYNMLHGVNPAAGVCLAMLELDPDDVGRFRDAYLAEDAGELRIFIYTRNGGGNREEYQDTIDALATKPEYVRDYDDDFDCTYATIVFRIPERFHEMVPELRALTTDVHPNERWQQTLDRISKTTHP